MEAPGRSAHASWVRSQPTTSTLSTSRLAPQAAVMRAAFQTSVSVPSESTTTRLCRPFTLCLCRVPGPPQGLYPRRPGPSWFHCQMWGPSRGGAAGRPC